MIRLRIADCGLRIEGGGGAQFIVGNLRAAVRMVFLAVLFLFCQTAEAGAPNTLARFSVSGSDYVSLAGWAKICGFTGRFDSRTKVLELSSRSARVSFTVDSRKAEINGVTTLLSLSVVTVGGKPMISVIDLHTTLQPLLFPAKSAKFRVRTVCLDPGHGGKDTGKIYGGAQEKQYTLLLAQEVSRLLKGSGINTVLTREKDQTLELSDRSAYAGRKGADLFVSLHFNAAANREVRGVETYCMAPPGTASSNEGGGRSSRGAYVGNIQNAQNVLLAHCLHKAIMQGTGIEDRGLKRCRFEVLREARMPAVLVEGGFMTNPVDFKKINDPVFRRKMAQGIVNGILSYKRAVEQPERAGAIADRQ